MCVLMYEVLRRHGTLPNKGVAGQHAHHELISAGKRYHIMRIPLNFPSPSAFLGDSPYCSSPHLFPSATPG